MNRLRATLPAVVAVALVASDASAQRRVTGTVTAVGGGPLSAASIQVIGTTTGTYTNETGQFSLTVPDGAASIRVRRIGYQQRVVPLQAGQSTVTVELQRDVLQLEAQVVTGAATTISRRNAANDVAQVTAAELTRTPTPTVENALQGKIAGANIVTNSGAPGGGAQFRIRGASSILGNTDPLIIVDGVILSNDAIQPGTNAVLGASAGSNASTQDNGVNRLADLNPNDIENIEVLKGSSASQIYGSRAGNGVIIITTKRGTSTAPQLNVTQRVGTYALLSKINTRRFTLEEAIARGEQSGLSEADVRDNYQRCDGFCDHQEALFGNTDPSYETNLSVRGGGPVAQYFVSGLVKRDAGIAQNTGYNKQSLRANLNSTLSQRLTAQVNTQLVHALTQRGFSNNDNNNITPYYVFAATPSFFDLRPRDGDYPNNPFSASNPLATYARSKTPEEVWRLIGSTNLDYSVLTTERQTLNVRLTGGIDQFNQQTSVVTPRDLQFEPADGLPGTSTYLSGTNVYGNGGLAVTHGFQPTSSLNFTTSIGAQTEYRSQRVSNIVSRDVLSGQENIQRGSSSEVFDARLRQVDQAFYLQEEMLAFDERLLLTAAVRGQRSSINGDATKFYTFPKFAASYRLPAFSVLNEIKLRGAYGQAGNPPLVTSQFTPVVGVVYGGQNGVQLSSRQGDPNIKPERQEEFEAGVDLAAFDSRASLAITGYRRNITDLLIRPALAPSTGFTQRDINAGELQNTGLEITGAVTPFQTRNASWLSRVTFARNISKVVSLPDIVGRVQCLNAAGDARETDPLKCPRGFTSGAFGFAYGQGRVEEGASLTQIVGTDTIPGGNGVTFQRKYGDTEPTFSLGFSNEFTLGPVRLYGLFDWRQGFEVVNLTQNTYDAQGTYGDVEGAERRVNDVDNIGLAPYIQDGSFVKLREITVSYAVPQRLAQRVLGGRANALSLEFSGRNLATWTKYEGVDPEVSNFGNTNVVRNQDLAPFPPSRSFFFSLNVAF